MSKYAVNLLRIEKQPNKTLYICLKLFFFFFFFGNSSVRFTSPHPKDFPGIFFLIAKKINNFHFSNNLLFLFFPIFLKKNYSIIVDELLDLVNSRANVCAQLHVPAQSGNTEVLDRMRRGYSRETYLEVR